MKMNINFQTIVSSFPFRTALSAVSVLAALSAFPLMATTTYASNCVPPAGSEYAGGVEQWATTLGTVELRNPIYSQFNECATPQASGSWADTSLTSLVSGEWFVNGSDLGPVSATSNPSHINYTVASNSGGVETITTQMLSMDVNLGVGKLIRIDPTTSSPGQTVITDVGGGNFKITSFFDIFTNVSLDDGETWYPSSGGNGAGGGALMTLQLATPEPGTAPTVFLGALGLTGFAWRRRQLAGRKNSSVLQVH